jgi:hypothetical protein
MPVRTFPLSEARSMSWFRFRTVTCRRAAGRKSSPGRSRRRQRRLRFEALEERRLMANLNLGLEVIIDATTQAPGTDGIVDVPLGTTFSVRVTAEDVRTDGSASQGVIALPLDIAWGTDPAVIRYADPSPPIFPDEIPTTNSVVTPNFVLQRFVDSFDVNNGTIAGLRGGALPNAGAGQAIGKGAPGEFSLLRFEAVGVGQTVFTADLSGSMSFADNAVLDNIVPPHSQTIIRVTAANAGLSGFVYVDADNDGKRDLDVNGMPAELPLPNVEIKLFRQGQAEFIGKVTTGPDGWYHFEDLAPGTYTIRETPPTGFVDGKDTPGVIIEEGQSPTPSGATVGLDEFSNIVLAAGQYGIDFNFGELGLSDVNKRLFLASTPSGEELVCKPLIAAAFVQGTAGADTITVDNDGESIRVRITPKDQLVYGPQQLKVFSLSQVKMVSIDALGGSDTVTINGTSADEVAQLQPGTASLRADVDPLTSGYGVKVKNAEDITVTAGTGTDLVVIRDSSGNDALTSSGGTVAIDWNGGKLTAKATGFDTARAITLATTREGPDEQDTATTQPDATTVLKLLGRWKTL